MLITSICIILFVLKTLKLESLIYKNHQTIYMQIEFFIYDAVRHKTRIYLFSLYFSLKVTFAPSLHELHTLELHFPHIQGSSMNFAVSYVDFNIITIFSVTCIAKFMLIDFYKNQLALQSTERPI